ncbi:MAG TPA: DUF3108 domain-containing protein [Deltaproteobacteria bacterium]|nr:DUF3108 domain-containing protein [Deltaproteobacteria bacterium]
MQRVLSTVLIVLAILVTPLYGEAASIGEKFSGESYSYTLGFWLFDDVAEAEISLEKKGAYYVATLKAHTKGFLDFIRHREDSYTAIMEEVDGGRRFRTVKFEKNIKLGKKVKKTITVLDYKEKIIRWQKWRKGKKIKEGTLPIPEGTVYDCPLTAFYNFRFGVYGAIKEGAQYRIKTLPKEDGKEIEIYLRILTDKEKVKRRIKKKKNPFPQRYYFADAKIPKKLFDSRSGKVEILFDEALIPFFAVARDVIFFGDVRGELIKHKVEQNDNTEPSEKVSK